MVSLPKIKKNSKYWTKMTKVTIKIVIFDANENNDYFHTVVPDIFVTYFFNNFHYFFLFLDGNHC